MIYIVCEGDPESHKIRGAYKKLEKAEEHAERLAPNNLWRRLKCELAEPDIAIWYSDKSLEWVSIEEWELQ